MGVDENLPVRRCDNSDRTLEQDRHLQFGGGVAHGRDPVLAELKTQTRKLPLVRSDDNRTRGHLAQGLGVQHRRLARSESLSDRLGQAHLVGQTRPHDVGVGAPLGGHDIRVAADRGPDHSGAGMPRAHGAQVPGTRVLVRAGRDADHASRVLVVAESGRWQKCGGVLALHNVNGRWRQGRVEADINQMDLAAHIGTQNDAGLESAESDSVIRGPDLPRGVAGVGLQTTGKVHRDRQFGINSVPNCDGIGTQWTGPADPHDGVEDHVRAAGLTHDGALPQGGAKTLRMQRLGGRHDVDLHAPAGQLRRREQRITPVVPAARDHTQAHAGQPTERVLDQECRGRCQARGRPLHQGAVRHGGHECFLSRTDGGDVVNWFHCGPPGCFKCRDAASSELCVR